MPLVALQPPASAAPNPPAPAAQDPAPPTGAEPEPEAESEAARPSEPVAIAPSKVETLVFGSVQVDGSASTGVAGNALAYRWSLESKPAASNAELYSATAQSASMYVDVVGTYKVKLVVTSGGKTSEPAYTTIEAIEAGALAPFTSFKASGLNVGTSASAIGGCSYRRSADNFLTFWSFANFNDFVCPMQAASAPDLQYQGANAGGTLDAVAMNVRYLSNAGISGKSQATWASVNTLSSYGYSLSAEPTELAKTPTGKASGAAFFHRMIPSYVQPWSTGTLQYRMEGTLTPANTAPGWDLAHSMTVVVTLTGPTFVNSQPATETVKLFERTFTADFDETIPLNLNWAQLPVAFENYAYYQVSVLHRIAFKRSAD